MTVQKLFGRWFSCLCSWGAVWISGIDNMGENGLILSGLSGGCQKRMY